MLQPVKPLRRHSIFGSALDLFAFGIAIAYPLNYWNKSPLHLPGNDAGKPYTASRVSQGRE